MRNLMHKKNDFFLCKNLMKKKSNSRTFSRDFLVHRESFLEQPPFLTGDIHSMTAHDATRRFEYLTADRVAAVSRPLAAFPIVYRRRSSFGAFSCDFSVIKNSFTNYICFIISSSR